MAGVTLVLSILILGGVIATIGDRLGTKIGKARLSLFGMRPKKTAVAVTILTGTIISFTTLGILFATNSQLRTGVFELESIQRKLRRARQDLEATQAERQRIEQERDQAREEQLAAEDRLNLTRDSLKQSIDRQQETQARLGAVAQRAETLRNEAQRLQQEQQTLIAQRDAVAQQIAQRNRDIAQRDRDIAQQEAKLSRQESQLGNQNARLSKQEAAISQQTAEISKRDEQIAAQRTIVAQGEAQVKELENTQAFLDEAIRERERGLLLLRQGNVALTRREVLATRVVRVLVPEATQQAINLLLQEANRQAIEAIRPGTEEEIQLIQITQAQVERLKEEIQDGREYVVRILSAGNYIQGEEQVLVFSDVVPNEVLFPKGQLLASTSVTLGSQADLQQLQDRIGLLIESSRFRARQAGVVSERTIIGDDRIGTLVRFYEQLQDYGGTLTLQSVTSAPAYTAGPLRINLVASRNGLELLSTDFEDN